MKNQKASPRAVPAPQQKEEEKPASAGRRPWYIALGVAGVLLLSVSITFALIGTVDQWEKKAFDFVNHAYLPEWVATQLAEPISNAVWGMVGLVLLLLAFPKFRLLSWQYAVAGGAAYAVVFALEHLVDRARPAGLESYDAILRASQGGPGFPSGHMAVLTALGLTIWPWVSWPWRILILLFICAEAWARVYLGMHAPLDIIGGIAVAMTVVAAIHLTPAKIRRFFKLAA